MRILTFLTDLGVGGLIPPLSNPTMLLVRMENPIHWCNEFQEWVYEKHPRVKPGECVVQSIKCGMPISPNSLAGRLRSYQGTEEERK